MKHYVFLLFFALSACSSVKTSHNNFRTLTSEKKSNVVCSAKLLTTFGEQGPPKVFDLEKEMLPVCTQFDKSMSVIDVKDGSNEFQILLCIKEDSIKIQDRIRPGDNERGPKLHVVEKRKLIVPEGSMDHPNIPGHWTSAIFESTTYPLDVRILANEYPAGIEKGRKYTYANKVGYDLTLSCSLEH